MIALARRKSSISGSFCKYISQKCTGIGNAIGINMQINSNIKNCLLVQWEDGQVALDAVGGQPGQAQREPGRAQSLAFYQQHQTAARASGCRRDRNANIWQRRSPALHGTQQPIQHHYRHSGDSGDRREGPDEHQPRASNKRRTIPICKN